MQPVLDGLHTACVYRAINTRCANVLSACVPVTAWSARLSAPSTFRSCATLSSTLVKESAVGTKLDKV